MTFTKFHIEEGHECDFDFLEIHDGPNSMSPALGRFCGNTLLGKSIVSTHEKVFLWFKSDSSVGGEGFQVDWTTSDPGMPSCADRPKRLR